jgi:hypothetical protein
LARKLFCLDLMLDLLGRHCFPPDKVGGATRFLPEHTMTLRLRKLMVQKNLDTLGRICPTIADELKGSALPKEAARGLHRVVQFVGPRPVDREGQPMARQQIAAADRKHRVLQLPRKGQGNPDDVLKEAFNLNWFPDAVTERQLENLFPNLVDEDIVLGDIDPARLTVT